MEKLSIRRVLAIMLTLPIMLSVAACGDDEVVSGGTKPSRSSVSSGIYSSDTNSDGVSGNSASLLDGSSATVSGSSSVVSGSSSKSGGSSPNKTSSATSSTTPLARKLPFSVGVNVDGLQDYSDGDYDRMPYFVDAFKSADTYKNIKSKGFDHVRLAVNFWRAYLDEKDKYTTEQYMGIVDTAIKHALDNGLYVMLNWHGWFNIGDKPGDVDTFISIWNKIAERYKDYDEKLVFEPINEPWYDNGRARPYLSDSQLNTMQSRVIKTIRGKGSKNTKRLIILCTADGNKAWKLEKLELPKDDNLAVAIHEYEPNSFTGQDFKWSGTGGQKISLEAAGGFSAVNYDFTMIKQFMANTKIPVVLNEFGLNVDSIPASDKDKWLRGIAQRCRDLGMPYTYWQYTDGKYTSESDWRNRQNSFAIYREMSAYGKKEWDKVVLDAIFLK